MVGEGDVTEVIGDSKIGLYENEYYGKLVQIHYAMLSLQSDVERGLTATELGPELKTLNTDTLQTSMCMVGSLLRRSSSFRRKAASRFNSASGDYGAPGKGRYRVGFGGSRQCRGSESGVG